MQGSKYSYKVLIISSLRNLASIITQKCLCRSCGIQHCIPRKLGGVSPTYWRRKWQPTPVLLPGKSHGGRSVVGSVHGVAKSRTRLSDFTSPTYIWNSTHTQTWTPAADASVAWEMVPDPLDCGLGAPGRHCLSWSPKDERTFVEACQEPH